MGCRGIRHTALDSRDTLCLHYPSSFRINSVPFDIFGHDSFALALSCTPFMLLLYAAEQKEYRRQGKKAALLTVPNVWKSLVIYTLLLPFLPFCGYIDDSDARYFILAADYKPVNAFTFPAGVGASDLLLP